MSDTNQNQEFSSKSIATEKNMQSSASMSPRLKHVFIRKPIISKTYIEKSTDLSSSSTSIKKHLQTLSPQLKPRGSIFQPRGSIFQRRDSKITSASPDNLAKTSQENDAGKNIFKVIKIRNTIDKFSKAIKQKKLNKGLENVFQTEADLGRRGSLSQQQQDEEFQNILQNYNKVRKSGFQLNNQQKYVNLKKLLKKLKNQGGKYKPVFQIIIDSIEELFLVDAGIYQELIKSVSLNGRYNDSIKVTNDYQSILNYVNDNFSPFDGYQKSKIKDLESQINRLQQQIKNDGSEFQDKILKIQLEKYDVELNNKMIKAEFENFKADNQKFTEKQKQLEMNLFMNEQIPVQEQSYMDSLQSQLKVANMEKQSLDIEKTQYFNLIKQCYSIITVIKELVDSQQENVLGQIKNLTQDSVIQALMKQIKIQLNHS